MYFLLFLAISFIIYVASFKDNFNQEHVQKVVPTIAAVTILIIVVIILNSLLGK